MKYEKLGIIGRFKPLHNGAYQLLSKACELAGEVTIGIGSANRDNVRNPFTYEETRRMIECTLPQANYRVVPLIDTGHIPEFADGSRWIADVRNAFGSVDAVVSGNPYVKELLRPHYEIISPTDLLGDIIPLKATVVRYALATSGWQEFVPPQVEAYLHTHGLDAYIREKYGAEILRSHSKTHTIETTNLEKEHVQNA